MNKRLQLVLGELKGPHSIFFFPGLFFLACGLLVIIAPRFVLAAVALFCIFTGLAMCYFAWRLLTIKRKLESTLAHVQRNFIIHGVSFSNQSVDENEDPRFRNHIIFH